MREVRGAARSGNGVRTPRRGGARADAGGAAAPRPGRGGPGGPPTRTTGRFVLEVLAAGARLEPDEVDLLAGAASAMALVREAVLDELGRDAPPCPHTFTVAVCTRDRADLLLRCLHSVEASVDGSGLPRPDVLVVDNAPPTTRHAPPSQDDLACATPWSRGRDSTWRATSPSEPPAATSWPSSTTTSSWTRAGTPPCPRCGPCTPMPEGSPARCCRSSSRHPRRSPSSSTAASAGPGRRPGTPDRSWPATPSTRTAPACSGRAAT